MTAPPDWPDPGKMHFRLYTPRLGNLDLSCENGYVVSSYDLGFPEVREVKLNNSLNDGTFDITRFYGSRAITLDIVLKGHGGIAPGQGARLGAEAELRDRLLGYMYPAVRPVLLFSEHEDERVRQIQLRASQASRAVGQARYNRVTCSWVAPRGILTSYDQECYRVYFTESSGRSVTITVNNHGTLDTDWNASISGEVTRAKIELTTLTESAAGVVSATTRTLQLDYETKPGDLVILDSYSRTVTVNGVRTPYSYIGNNNSWFKLPPGISQLTITHDATLAFQGYPYAYWQAPATPPITDEFNRANGTLGAAWEVPAVLPAGTVAVPLAIASNAVVVTAPDNGTGPHEWGFARNVSAISGGLGMVAEIDVGNLAQAAQQGPVMRSQVELYTNMRTADAACQALTVGFDYGITTPPLDPVIMRDPMETTGQWTVTGRGVSTTANGRNGRAVQVTGTNARLSYPIASADRASTIIVGFGVTLGTVANDRNLLQVWSQGVVTGAVAVAAGGSLYATDGAGVNRDSTPAGSITANSWYYIEVRYVLSTTAGSFSVRIDGVEVAAAFNLNTKAAGAGTVYDEVVIPAPNVTSGGTHIYDDVYIVTGPDAAFLGPQDVPNGTLDWSLHHYDPDGTSASPTASGVLPWNYTATDAATLRLESGHDGEQRFILNDTLIATVFEGSPIDGTLAGFAASYQTFSYPDPPGGFTDDFERAALGSDWVLPVARAAGKKVVLPTISTGAAISAGHATNATQYYNGTTATGSTLVGGIALTMPSGIAAKYLALAHVYQTNGPGTPITASTGWTAIGTQVVLGSAAGPFQEAFDHFGAWTTSGTCTIVAGRTGNAAQITGSNGSNYADYRLPTPDATVIVGFAFQVGSLTAASEVCQFLADNAATLHGRIVVNTNGSLAYIRYPSTTLGTTATGLIAANTWNYLEVRTTLSDTVGTVDIRLNGTSVLSLTAQDTKNAGTATVYDTVRVTGPGSGSNRFDDLYILTGSGAAFTGSQTFATSSGTEYLRLAVFGRVCDGSSKDAITLTGNAGDWVAGVELFYQQSAGYPIDSDILTRMRFATASGFTGFPDPPSISLSMSDWLFMESAGIDVQTFPSMSQSSNYSTLHSTTVSPASQVALRAGYRTTTAGGTEDPGAYSGTSGRPWIAFTIGLPNNAGLQWGAAEYNAQDLDATRPMTVEAVVNSTATGGPPMVELYTHMVPASPVCRVLQIDLYNRTWRMGHYAATGDDMVAAASGSLPAGATPWTFRYETDPDRTMRFLMNGTLVQSVVDATAVAATGAVHVGFGEFSSTSYTPAPQVRSIAATGTRFLSTEPPPTPTSPRIDSFMAGVSPGTNWAVQAPATPGDILPFVAGNNPNYQNYPVGAARPGAPRVEEDEVPATTPPPTSAALTDYRGAGSGSAVYANGWVYDGYGWRNSSGQAVTRDGLVIQTGGLPPNLPPPGGKPPWAWTPAVDPLTGEPTILSMNFCFFDLWL